MAFLLFTFANNIVLYLNIQQYLDDEKYGTYSYLIEQKKKGRIRHLGFSCHGEMPVLKAFLEKYGKDMEFCQLQLNYFDWKFQDAKAKVELLKEYGIPVWVMEPLRGGRLCRLEDSQEEALRRLRPEESIAAWSFRFLQSVPEVTMVLSGMSSLDQLKQNIETFCEDRPLNEEEMDGLMKITDQMIGAAAIPCTACHYCVSHCPQELDIPRLLAMYNQLTSTTGTDFITPMALSAMPEEEHPSACLGCRSCERVCPQQIHISEWMEKFASAMGEEMQHPRPRA